MSDELDVLMERLGRQRFMFHQFRVDQHGPDVLAAVHDWGEAADVVILADEYNACAYRTPRGHSVDVFEPEAVYWWFTASPKWTIRALLELPQPAHPNAPRELIHAPSVYTLPKESRTPVRVRMREN